MLQHEELVLASASQIRKQLLEAAGLRFKTKPAGIDEAAIKEAVHAQENEIRPSDIAQLLAQTKASVVSEGYPDALVIGSDQILVAENRLVSKPATKDEALDQLIELRGKSHELISAVAVARNGEILWSFEDVARLSMRNVSTSFLGVYLAEMGEKVTDTVGAYQLEGLGVHLFEKIDGDYFTILGLPLLPLLAFLRSRNENLV